MPQQSRRKFLYAGAGIAAVTGIGYLTKDYWHPIIKEEYKVLYRRLFPEASPTITPTSTVATETSTPIPTQSPPSTVTPTATPTEQMSEDETMIRQLMVAWRDLYNTGNVSSTARALIKGASGGWNLNIQRSPVTVMYTMEATSHSNQPHLVSEGMIPVGSTAKEIGICFLATNLEKSEANAWPSDFVELNPSTWGILAPSSKTYITTQPTSTSTPTPTPTPTETPTPSPTTTTPTTETPKPTTPSTTTQQTGWDTNTLVILVIVVIVIVTVGALITKKRRAKQK